MLFKKRLHKAVSKAALKMFGISSKSYAEFEDGTKRHLNDEFIRGAFCALLVMQGVLEGAFGADDIFRKVLQAFLETDEEWETRFEFMGGDDD